jgi:phage shock protein A
MDTQEAADQILDGKDPQDILEQSAPDLDVDLRGVEDQITRTESELRQLRATMDELSDWAVQKRNGGDMSKAVAKDVEFKAKKFVREIGELLDTIDDKKQELSSDLRHAIELANS